MKRTSIALSTLLVLMAIPVLAAEPATRSSVFEGGISPGEVKTTPEMWFYEQYRRDYENPKMAVRKNAEFRAAQRQRRMAALKWFGFSNQRPLAGCDPYHADFSPRWTSNNGVYPFRWSGVARPWVLGWPTLVAWPGSSAVSTY